MNSSVVRTPGGFLKSENKVSLLLAVGVKVQIERFTGEKDNFILWWNNFEYYKRLGKWDDATSVLKLFTCIDTTWPGDSSRR